jgi:hypothetical protein
MKPIHLLLILIFIAIAALQQGKITRIHKQEAALRQEITSLESYATAHITPASADASMRPKTMNRARPQDDQPLRSRVIEDLRNMKYYDQSNIPEHYAQIEAAIAKGDLAEAIRHYILSASDDPDSFYFDKIILYAETPELKRSIFKQAAISAKEPVFSRIVTALTKEADFETNLDLIGQVALTPEKHDLAAGVIAAQKINDQTPDRAAWLLDSLQTDQTAPITHLAQSWTQKDYKAANTWVNSLPPGRTRDAAVAGFARTAAKIDGASAVDWALTISDPTQRASTLEAVTKIWKSREPAATAAYLTEKGIEAEKK